MLEDTHTRVAGAEINANCRSLRHGCLSVGVARDEQRSRQLPPHSMSKKLLLTNLLGLIDSMGKNC